MNTRMGTSILDWRVEFHDVLQLFCNHDRQSEESHSASMLRTCGVNWMEVVNRGPSLIQGGINEEKYDNNCTCWVHMSLLSHAINF